MFGSESGWVTRNLRSNNLPFQAPCNSWVEFGYYVLRGAPSWTWPGQAPMSLEVVVGRNRGPTGTGYLKTGPNRV